MRQLQVLIDRLLLLVRRVKVRICDLVSTSLCNGNIIFFPGETRVLLELIF